MAQPTTQAEIAATPVPMYNPANDLDAFSAPEAAAEAAPAEAPAATDPPAEVEPAPETLDPETQPEEAPEVPAGQEPPVTEDPKPAKILPNRIATGQFEPIEQEAIAYRKQLRDAGESISLKESIEIVEAKHEKAATAARAKAEQSAATPDPVSLLETEVATLEAEINEAGENEALFDGALAKKVTSLNRKTAELERLKWQVQQASTTAVTAHVQSREQVKAEVLAKYADAGDRDTLLGARVAALIGELNDPSHPEHSRMLRPDAPAYAVKEAIQRLATKRGISFEAMDAELQGKPEEAPVAPMTAKPAGPKPVAGNKAITPAAASSNTGAPPQPAAPRDLRRVSYKPGEDDEAIFGKQRQTISIGAR